MTMPSTLLKNIVCVFAALLFPLSQCSVQAHSEFSFIILFMMPSLKLEIEMQPKNLLQI